MHPLVMILLIAAIAAVMTYIIPAGVYDRAMDEATGKMVVVPDTFHFVDQAPVGLGAFFLSFQNGIVSSASIVGFLLLIGGGFGVLNSTGAVDALMARAIVRFKSERSKELLIFGLLTFFALSAAVYGMSLESLLFVPFLISLMIALRFDALLAVGIPVIGCAIGYGASFINPFNVGVAQQIAELPYLSGMWYRILFFIVTVTAGGVYLIRYGLRVERDPQRSLCRGSSFDTAELHDPGSVQLTRRHKLALCVFGLSIAVLIYGAMFRDFFMNECATVFMVMGVAVGLVSGYKPSEIAEHFIEGAKGMLMAALIVAFSRSIILILEAGQIMDTIIYYAVLPLRDVDPLLTAPLMVVVQTFLNLLVNSGSGQAIVSMPIMVPIADLLHIDRQVAVLAFQIGDGFSNMFWFTAPSTMVGMSLAKVGYSDWLRFVGKLMLILMILGMAAVSLAQLIHLGPA